MAGFFGFFDFEKAGKGVNKNEPKKYRFFLFFEYLSIRFWKLATLNMLYIAACLPIITIGPATAGFTLVLRNFARDEHAFVWSDFIGAAKKNWKQSLAVSIINAIFGFLLFSAIYFYYQTAKDIMGFLPVGLGLFFVLCYLFMQYYIYIMIVTFKFSLKQLYKNSLILALAALRTNIITTFFLLLIWLFLAFLFISNAIGFSIVIFIVLSIAVSLSGFIIVFNSYPHIQKHIIDPYYAEQEKLNGEESKETLPEAIFKDRGREDKN